MPDSTAETLNRLRAAAGALLDRAAVTWSNAGGDWKLAFPGLPIYHIADYGAKVDNATDDYTAIAAAASAASAAGGGIVWIPVGVAGSQCCFGSTLPLYNDVWYMLANGATAKWIGAAGGIMWANTTSGGPLVRGGVVPAPGALAKIAPNSAADNVYDLHSPQGCIFGPFQYRDGRDTTIIHKIRTDVATTTGSLAGTYNAIHNQIEYSLYGLCNKVFELTGTSGKVITLNHFKGHQAGNLQGTNACFADCVDYADTNYFDYSRANLAANNATMFNFRTANTYNNSYTACAPDTFAGPTGRVCVTSGASSSRNRGYLFNNPRAEGGLQSDAGSLSYRIEAHSVDPDSTNAAIEIHKKNVIDFGVAWHVRSLSANTTLTNEDVVVLGTGGAGGITVTLPPATNKGQMLVIKQVDAGAGGVTISRAGTDTIDGVNSVALAGQYHYRMLVADGVSTWGIVASG